MESSYQEHKDENASSALRLLVQPKTRQRPPQQQQQVASFSTRLTKEQVDGLSKLQATDFLRHLNLSVNNTKLKMRQVLHDFF
jgi:hypothetical protein